MKTYSLIFIFLFTAVITLAQTAINTTGDQPDPSAILDVQSTTQGILFPRMTRAERDAIATPGDGLIIFQTDETPGYYFYNGGTSSWQYFADNSNSWIITGNSGTVSGTNFLGTTDAIPLNFRVHNTEAGRIDSAQHNTFFGFDAGKNSTAGIDNTAFGYEALNINDSSENTAFGAYALHLNTKGKYNTAIGASALEYNSEADYNTALGYRAMLYNTYAGQNTAVGVNALHSQSYTNSNTPWNTNNTAVGNAALYNNDPTANTNGLQNTAVGDSALYGNQTGSNNLAVGYKAHYGSDTSDMNVAIGYEALSADAGGDDNVATGFQALYRNSTGHTNTAIGYRAGDSITTGSYNTLIGYNASATYDTVNNVIALAGEGNLPFSGSNQVRMGNSVVTSIGGQVSWTSTSDRRKKENISANVPGLSFIMRLNPVTYTFNLKKENQLAGFNNPSPEMQYYTEKNSRIIRTGFLAQEVEQAAIESGFHFDGVDKPDDNKSLWGLRYSLFTMPLIKAVQEQNEMIRQNNEAIAQLRKQLAKTEMLEQRLEQLKSMLNNKSSEK